MTTDLTQLKPLRVWYFFNEITKIPRASKNEAKIREYLLNFGRRHGLETLADDAGNVLIRKNAFPGLEKMEPVILQSHMDMVCEKNTGTTHNFETDPVKAYVDGDWVRAEGTTLGADDGIGMAAQLAILESANIQHGPLECLFTVDEESGMTGALGLRPGFLEGRILLNLDSEDEGQLFIGCAGGLDTVATMEFLPEPVPQGTAAFRISVTGLKGGHSGDEIHKGLGNSNKILNRLLWKNASRFGIRIASFNGGNLRNAIPREAFAVVSVPSQLADAFGEKVKEFAAIVREELKVTEPDLSVVMQPAEAPGLLMDAATQSRLLNALYACPHGVLAMSADIPGLVETSTNLASVKTSGNKIVITTSQRSSVESAKYDAAFMVESVFLLAGAAVKHGEGYPGWKPDMNSRILEITRTSYQRLFGKPPLVLAIHAGLECGLIGEKYPGMDMISIGPTLRGVHSPDERIHIGTVQQFWDLVLDILKSIPG